MNWYRGSKPRMHGTTGSEKSSVCEVRNQLRYGRGLDNRKLKAAGYNYGFTSREAVLKHAEAMRARPLRRGEAEPYRYEREVEEFLRWSPNVRRRGTA